MLSNLVTMVDLLSSNTLIAVFLVIAVGAWFGTVKFGPIRFGAAGALFLGLVIGAFVVPDHADLTLLQNLGLGLFVYLIGLEAGEEFFHDIKAQFGLMAASVVAVTIGAVVAVFAGMALGLSREFSVGAFAGSLTSTPSLSLAQAQTGSSDPAVGYSLGYPTGIIMAIILVLFTVNKEWKAKKDQLEKGTDDLRGVLIRVTNPMTRDELSEIVEGDYVLASIRRHGKLHFGRMNYQLEKGDEAYFMTNKATHADLVAALGQRLPLQRLRSPHVTVQRYTVSNSDITGKQIGELGIFKSEKAQVLRIIRGDETILATPDTALDPGDDVEVAHETMDRDAVEKFFGNSAQVSAELDWVPTALGLFAGFALAIVPIPLPGGNEFEMGAAGGPLIIGLILGALRRTGKLSWKLPATANFTLRQYGLMLFLAAVGLASGEAFASAVFSMTGLKLVLLSALVSVAACGSMLAAGFFMGRSATRSNGAVAGLLGQPAVLQYAMQNTTDSRVMSGYSATFAIALIYKILVIPFMLV